MEFIEKDLENILFELLSSEKGYDILTKQGLNIPPCDTWERQSKIGNYGIPDIIGYNKSGSYYEIIELKLKKIGLKALMQSVRYAKGIIHKCELNNINRPDYGIIIIGREIDLSDDFVYLFDVCSVPCKVFLYSFEIDGLRFKELDLEYYSMKDHGIIPMGESILAKEEWPFNI